jgi:hypothetical protein
MMSQGEWHPVEGLPTIFHPSGCFKAPDGWRFDYIFAELQPDPSTLLKFIPDLRQLLEQAGQEACDFGGRLYARLDRMSLGFNSALPASN